MIQSFFSTVGSSCPDLYNSLPFMKPCVFIFLWLIQAPNPSWANQLESLITVFKKDFDVSLPSLSSSTKVSSSIIFVSNCGTRTPQTSHFLRFGNTNDIR